MTRINRFIADISGISRRKADELIADGKIKVNGVKASPGYIMQPSDRIASNDPNFKFNHLGSEESQKTTIILNKPVGYVCSRNGQGSKTIYDLLPKDYHYLKPVGRLDKDSSGIILLTNDGKLANKLTHPKYQKSKTYQVKLDKKLSQQHKEQLLKGVKLDDGLSKFDTLKDCSKYYEVTISEGRNRQIRRTFEATGYKVTALNRTEIANYKLNNLKPAKFAPVK